MTEKTITLNCVVFGSQPIKVHKVKIAKARTATGLRKEIAQLLQAVDANAVRLYHLTGPILKADIENKLAIFQGPHEIPCAEELSPQARTKISTLFPSPKEEAIHVIIGHSSAGEYKLSFNNFDPV